jgi:hypothetical protein
LNDLLHRIELTNGRLLGLMNNNEFSNDLMTRELQSTPEAPGIEWHALRNHILCMAHIIQRALGAFMRSLGVRCQSLRKEGNGGITKVSARRPGLAKII